MKEILLSEADLEGLIRMAWHDRTTFEEIQERLGLSEAQVIGVMRRHLKPSSFRRWRKRMRGRVTKHRKLFERRKGKWNDPD